MRRVLAFGVRAWFVVGALGAVLASAGPALGQATPGEPAVALAPWRRANIDHAALVSTFGDGAVRTLTLPLPEGEGVISLELQSFDVAAPHAAFVVDGMNGPRSIPRPDVLLLRGTVDGDPSSRAFLGSSPTGVHGFIEHGGRTYVISSGPCPDAGPHATVLVAALEGDLGQWLAAGGFNCTVLVPPEARPVPVSSSGGSVDSPCRLVEVAIETDWEFTGALFGGSTQASGAYAMILTAASSEVYRRDLNLGIQITYMRLWDDADDPWTGGDSSAQLTQFRGVWNATMGAVQRDGAHFFSGRGLGGGVAWLNSVCNSTAYALSGNLAGGFPYPIQNNSGSNWDLMVVSHEWGHNFGAQHTHDLNPPPDLCGANNCAGAAMGTIMSYCHLCSGGMANMRMEFHPQSQAQMDAYLGTVAPCVAAPALTVAVGEAATTVPGNPIDLDVLSNDLGLNCTGVSLAGFDPMTPMGGTVERLTGAGPGGRDMLRYTPPAVGAGPDFVSYAVQAAGFAPSSSGVAITLLPFREPVAPTNTLPGLAVEYYALPIGVASLPAFATLTPASSAVVSAINIASTGGVFGGSGLSEGVGAVYSGYLVVPASGLYTLATESDDGSRLLIGSEVVVNNDGLHGMLERSGVIALAAGAHPLRVEFFENQGGAGLIARLSGAGLQRQVIPASMLRRDNPCRPDLTTGAVAGQPGYGVPNGVLGTEDFFYYLAKFSDGSLAVADLTTTATSGQPGFGVPDGLLTTDDFFYYLILYAAGC